MSKRSPAVQNVGKLPPKLRELVERMLVEGATFEDVVDAAKERGGAELALPAVEAHFRSSQALQRKRILHQLEAAHELKKAIGNPRSAQAELADAVLLTGLTRLNRHDSMLDLAEALKQHFQRENLVLKQENLDLKKAKQESDEKLSRARMRNELIKLRLAKNRFIALHRSIEANGKNQKLGPETIERIQEIYGLVVHSGKKATASAQGAPAQAR